MDIRSVIAWGEKWGPVLSKMYEGTLLGGHKSLYIDWDSSYTADTLENSSFIYINYNSIKLKNKLLDICYFMVYKGAQQEKIRIFVLRKQKNHFLFCVFYSFCV